MSRSKLGLNRDFVSEPMYFATGSAKTLAIGVNEEIQNDSIIGIWVNVRRTHFVVLSKSDVAVWRVRSLL